MVVVGAEAQVKFWLQMLCFTLTGSWPTVLAKQDRLIHRSLMLVTSRSGTKNQFSIIKIVNKHCSVQLFYKSTAIHLSQCIYISATIC